MLGMLCNASLAKICRNARRRIYRDSELHKSGLALFVILKAPVEKREKTGHVEFLFISDE